MLIEIIRFNNVNTFFRFFKNQTLVNKSTGITQLKSNMWTEIELNTGKRERVLVNVDSF